MEQPPEPPETQRHAPGQPPEPPSERALVVSALLFYAVMVGIGLGAMAFEGPDIRLAIFGGGKHLLTDTALGAGTGLGVVLLTRLTARWAPLKRLNDELSELLGSPGTGSITVLAVTSAVGEEIFFRGALQPLLGYWLTALVFGLVHGGTARRFRAWAIFALLAGLLLGWLALYTGNLLAPMLCHLTVNYYNLHTDSEDTPRLDHGSPT